MRGHGSAALGEDFLRLWVIPIVDHAFQQVGVTTGRQPPEEVASHAGTTVRDAGGSHERLRTLHHGRQVKQDATRLSVVLQDAREQGPLPPPRR